MGNKGKGTIRRALFYTVVGVLAGAIATGCGSSDQSDAASGGSQNDSAVAPGDCVDTKSPAGTVVAFTPIECTLYQENGNSTVTVLSVDSEPRECDQWNDVFAHIEQDGHDYCLGLTIYHRPGTPYHPLYGVGD